MIHLSGRDRQGDVPYLRPAYSAAVNAATKAGSGFAQAGRHFAVLTYWKYVPRVIKGWASGISQATCHPGPSKA